MGISSVNIRKLWKFLKESDYRFSVMASHGFLRQIPDDIYLERLFKIRVGYPLNLSRPRTFNEKLQWLKLHDRKPEYTMMVDKYAVKRYVAEHIGSEYVIPTLGVWDRFDDIDFDALPNQFVLKCTHDSGGNVIVRDKNTFDRKAARKKIISCLRRNYYWSGREWPYKNVEPRIIAEKYMEDTETRELRDYKFFTFDGTAKALYVVTDRNAEAKETRFDFFDAEFKHLPFTRGHSNADYIPSRPKTFELMKKLSEKLSRNILHVRVDFYEVNGKVYFGEMTFYSDNGFKAFEPPEWDEKFGEWIHLPVNSNGGGVLIRANGYILFFIICASL